MNGTPNSWLYDKGREGLPSYLLKVWDKNVIFCKFMSDSGKPKDTSNLCM